MGFSFNTYTDIPLFCVCFGGIILHLLLLNAFAKDPLKCFRNSGTYLVANLAVSDLLVCLITPFTTVLLMTRFHMYLECLRATFHGGSVITLTFISIERFVIVAYPLKHRLFINGKVISVCLVFIWLFSCIYPAKTLFLGFQDHDISFALYFGEALLILDTVIYIFTYIKLKKQSQNIHLSTVTSATHASTTRILKQKRFLRTIFLIACVYAICSTPVLTFSQVVLRYPYYNQITVQSLLSVLYQVNFAINPLIYFSRLPNYRRTFYIICCKKGMPSPTAESSRI